MTDRESLAKALAGLATPSAGPTARAWLDRSKADLEGGQDSFIVERQVAGQRLWYGVGTNDRATRQLFDEVTAFVGPTYGSVDRPVGPIEVGDDRESAVRAIPGVGLFRIRTVSSEDADIVDRQLEMLRAVRARRPNRSRGSQRPVSLIIRDLDTATVAGELTRMRTLLSELKESGNLSGVNLECLEIRGLAAESRWGEILARPGIDDLVTLRLPRDAASTLIEAVYRVYVEGEERRSPAELLELFRERVLPRFGRLFRTSYVRLNSTTRKAWMLFALSGSPPADSLRTELLGDDQVGNEDRQFLELLSRAVAPTGSGPTSDARSTVERLIEDGQLDEAWSLAYAGSEHDSRWRTRVLIYCAFESARPSYAASALAVLDAGDAPELLAMRTVEKQVAELRDLVTAESNPITDWVSWLSALAHQEGPSNLLALARESAEAWDASALLASETAANALLEVATGDETRSDVLRDARPLVLPKLLSGYEDVQGASNATSFLLLLTQTICADKRIGQSDLEAVLALADALLAAGLSPGEYATLVTTCLLPTWRRVSSPKSIGWLGDALQLLADQPCFDESARSSFAGETAGSLSSIAAGLPQEHWIALDEVYARLGQTDAVEAFRPLAAVETTDWRALGGRKIFIYTLVEHAGDRARDYLVSHESTASVAVWSEHDAEPRMIDAARKADIVVIATKAAKHSATGAIERAVTTGHAVVYPTGKGWSSIVSAVRDHLPTLVS